MKELIVNIVLAIIWLFLSRDQTVIDLMIGFVVGFAVLAVFQKITGSTDYVRRVLAFVRFSLVFLREFILSNVQVAVFTLTVPRRRMHPQFITMDVTGMTETEIVILAQSITLTPGTTAVEVSDDCTSLLIHFLDPGKGEDKTAEIRKNFKEPIMSFMR
ncbi:MAG: Na+/H+ antiporter subunit E [Opitutales bacterium]|nr:Na+/H+ antiporter subunit E [Opitutales bacterium]